MTVIDRIIDAVQGAFDWLLDTLTIRRLVVAGLVVVALIVLVEVAYPCTQDHRATCTSYCTMWTGQTAVTVPCGQYECDVCDERRWRWSEPEGASGHVERFE